MKFSPKTTVDEAMRELASVILETAKAALVDDGYVTPCVSLLAMDGGLHVIAIEIDEDLVGKREAYAEVSRKARELNAVAAFMLNDAWVKPVIGKPGDTPESIVAQQPGPVRNDPQRQEAILVVGMGPIFRNFVLAAPYAKEGNEIRFGQEGMAENMQIGLLTPWWD